MTDEEYLAELYGGERDYDEGPEDEPPLFGCACEDPLTVDTVCPSCIDNLRRQHIEADGGPRLWLMRTCDWFAWARARFASRLWWLRERVRDWFGRGEELPF